MASRSIFAGAITALAVTSLALAGVPAAQAAPLAAPQLPMAQPKSDGAVFNKPGKNISVKLNYKKYCSVSKQHITVKVKAKAAKGTMLCSGRVYTKGYLHDKAHSKSVYANFIIVKRGKKTFDYLLNLSPRVRTVQSRGWDIYMRPRLVGYTVGSELVKHSYSTYKWFNGVKNLKLNLFINFASDYYDKDAQRWVYDSSIYSWQAPVTVKVS